MHASERLVLPRLQDLVENALCLMPGSAEDERSMFFTIDLEDAFCSVGLRSEAERHLCAKHPVQGFISYKTVLLGGARFPLYGAEAAPSQGDPARVSCAVPRAEWRFVWTIPAQR